MTNEANTIDLNEAANRAELAQATEGGQEHGAPSKLTREDVEKLGADCGWDAAKVAEVWERMEAAREREERLAAKGLKVTYRKALLRITNTRWSHGGRLQDGTCHYQMQTTVEGNTYPVKDSLKAAGYRWHPGDRLWYRPIKAGTSIHDMLEETKDLLA